MQSNINREKLLELRRKAMKARLHAKPAVVPAVAPVAPEAPVAPAVAPVAPVAPAVRPYMPFNNGPNFKGLTPEKIAELKALHLAHTQAK